MFILFLFILIYFQMYRTVSNRIVAGVNSYHMRRGDTHNHKYAIMGLCELANIL